MGTLHHFDAQALNDRSFHGGRRFSTAAWLNPEQVDPVNQAVDPFEMEVTTNKLMKGILVAVLFEVTVVVGFIATWHLWCLIR